MIEKLRESSGNVIGYKVSGTITKDDYANARQAKYFHTADRDAAWEWIRTG